jgi:hypothetical protein
LGHPPKSEEVQKDYVIKLVHYSSYAQFTHYSPLLHHHATTPHNLSTTPFIISYDTHRNKASQPLWRGGSFFTKHIESLMSISTLCDTPPIHAGTFWRPLWGIGKTIPRPQVVSRSPSYTSERKCVSKSFWSFTWWWFITATMILHVFGRRIWRTFGEQVTQRNALLYTYICYNARQQTIIDQVLKFSNLLSNLRVTFISK